MADLTYVDLDEYIEIPQQYIAEAGSRYVNRQISIVRASIYARLLKLYDVPTMQTTEPEIIKLWIASIVAPKIYRKRGVDPTDLQFQDLRDQASEAQKAIDNAANTESGLYDLPLLNTTTGKNKINIKSKSQADPAAWKRDQADKAHLERCWPRSYRY